MNLSVFVFQMVFLTKKVVEKTRLWYELVVCTHLIKVGKGISVHTTQVYSAAPRVNKMFEQKVCTCMHKY